MAEQTRPLRDRLARYCASADDSLFFDNVKQYDIFADTDKRMLQISVVLTAIVPKHLIGRIEAGLCKAYQLNRAQIVVKYDGIRFSEDYIPELIAECERRGHIVMRGFCVGYRAHVHSQG